MLWHQCQTLANTHGDERLYGSGWVRVLHLAEVREVQRCAAVLPVRQVRGGSVLQQHLKQCGRAESF